MIDAELERMHWGSAGMDAYLEAEARLCHCEALCTCGWDDPDTLVMIQLERVYGWRVINTGDN